MSSLPSDSQSLTTLAQKWLDCTDRLEKVAASSARVAPRFSRQHTFPADKALMEASSAAAALARRAAGALAHEWGVFSVVGGVTLEDTLALLARRGAFPDQTIDAAMDLVHRQLPAHRAHLVLDLYNHTDSEFAIAEIVTSLVWQLPPVASVRRALIHHLPGERRPIASALDELDTVTTRLPVPFTLSVTDSVGVDSAIKLHDIVVRSEMRGAGYGSAALIELCRFADHHGRAIIAHFMPNDSDNGDALRGRYARWYYRHGFRQGARRPEQWVLFAPMTRPAQGA